MPKISHFLTFASAGSGLMLELVGPGLKKARHRLNQFPIVLGTKSKKSPSCFQKAQNIADPYRLTEKYPNALSLKFETRRSSKPKTRLAPPLALARKNEDFVVRVKSGKSKRFFGFMLRLIKKKFQLLNFFGWKTFSSKNWFFPKIIEKKLFLKKYENCNSIWNSISVEIFCVCAEGFGFSNSF